MKESCWLDLTFLNIPPDHLLLDRSPNIGPLLSRWELDKFKNYWNKIAFEPLEFWHLYQQFSNWLNSQRDMSGPRSGALYNNRWSGGTELKYWIHNSYYFCISHFVPCIEWHVLFPFYYFHEGINGSAIHVYYWQAIVSFAGLETVQRSWDAGSVALGR